MPDAEETKSPRKKFGTLVWVLLSVSVVVFFLFAMAAPKFGRFAFNVKAREAKLNIASIRTAEQSYFNEFGVHVPAPAAPLGTPGVLKMPWPESSEGFEKIGWEPEGNVYCSYGVAVEGPAFTAEAICDLDGDGEFQAHIGNFYLWGPAYQDAFSATLDWIKKDWAGKGKSGAPKVAIMSWDSAYGREPLNGGKEYAEKLGIELLPSELFRLATLNSMFI